MYIGQIIDGRFELGRPFESSADTEVFLARDRKQNQLVIVKFLHDKNSKEAEILRKLHHEGIIRSLYQTQWDGGFLLAEDFFPGVTLRHYVQKRKRLSENEILQIALQTADILRYLHAQRPPVIYRDLKPDNLLIGKDGRVKLIDFGAAKYYVIREDADDICLGTQGYAAPEQYEDSHSQSDARTDLYGLGAILFFMLTGLDPNGKEKNFQRARFLRPEISDLLYRILIRCTKADPEQRYNGADSLLYDLNRCCRQ